jgi:hypothetical protein
LLPLVRPSPGSPGTFSGSFEHLSGLCETFVDWYNGWRPHARHDGFTPDQVFHRDLPEHVPKTAKTAPLNIERRIFEETKITGFRLKDAA